MQKPLSGIRIIEIEGIGPGPFCGMLLSDLGAEITLIARPGGAIPIGNSGQSDPMTAGKTIIELNLKDESDAQKLKDMIGDFDALFEGMRPGVMERLGLGPSQLAPLNPQLVYGRLTGWGQNGPLAHAAGHDINYIALSGALWYAGQPGQPPLAPPTLIGDIGGGALYMAIGILSGILQARQSGKGTVIDAAIVDGSSHMMNLLLAAQSRGIIQENRGQSLLDGPHWYSTYQCADGHYVTVGSLEPQFYALLLRKLGLADDPYYANQYNGKAWPELREKFKTLFKSKTRDEWCDLLEGTDVCFGPVLTPSEAAEHPHIKARNIYSKEDGTMRAAPAPRFGPLE